MNYLILPIRFIAVLCMVLLAFVAAILLSKTLPIKAWSRFVQVWAKAVLFCVGAKVEIVGTNNPEYSKSNRMIIANHISWLDIPVLFSIYWVNFVGRAEMQKWPILKTVIKAGGTVFIDRANKRELVNVNKTVSQALIEGKSVGLFPEGKTGDGKTMLPFKSSLLEAAILSNSTITPTIIKYQKRDGSIATEVSYSGNISLYQSAKSCLLLNGIHVKITILPELKATDFKCRDILTHYLFDQIQTGYSKENSNARTKS